MNFVMTNTPLSQIFPRLFVRRELLNSVDFVLQADAKYGPRPQERGLKKSWFMLLYLERSCCACSQRGTEKSSDYR